MPVTSKERTRKYVEKLKTDGKYDDLKKKKAERETLRRQRLKESLKKLSESKRKQVVDNARKQCLERVRKFRARAKQGNAESDVVCSEEANTSNASQAKLLASQRQFLLSSYKTDGAASKATTKLRKMLPKSPSKCEAVVERFFYSLKDSVRDKIIHNKTRPNKGGNKGIGTVLTEEITLFYERDDVSRMSANTKDTRYYRNPKTGDNEVRQKRYMVVTLEQAYNKFLIETAEKYQNKPPVKLAKFGALRPAHVKLVNSTPQTVCLCIYHENMQLICAALHKNLPQFPVYGQELKRILTCNDNDKDCWLKNCSKCSPQIVEKKLKGTGKKKINWWRWDHDDTTNRTEKKMMTGTVKQLMDHFINVYQSYLQHSFTNHKQRDSFNEDVEYVDSHYEDCLIQVDFAENYTYESQDEVVNAHWNQKQISLFTLSMRYWKKQFSKVIVSDNLDHSKDTIFAYMHKAFSMIPKKIKTVRIWSDGPNNQFKNRFTAAAMKIFETKFRKRIIWNYHATAHGKSCVDGIGAVAKSKMKRLVNSRKFVVNSAKDFATAFKDEPSKVYLIEMSSAEITKINKSLKLDEIFSAAPAVKDISKFHQLRCQNNNIKGFMFSKDGYALQ